jgi:hypothetical protein
MKEMRVLARMVVFTTGLVEGNIDLFLFAIELDADSDLDTLMLRKIRWIIII